MIEEPDSIGSAGLSWLQGRSSCMETGNVLLEVVFQRLTNLRMRWHLGENTRTLQIQSNARTLPYVLAAALTDQPSPED